MDQNMFEKKFQKLTCEWIDLNDSTYRYSFTEPDKSLIASVRTSGLVNPIVVQQLEKKYIIITGFKRALAVSQLGLDECPAFVIEASDVNLELLMLAIQDNQSVRTLHAIELARILDKLQTHFHIEKDMIIKEYLPQLGYGRNPRVLQLYSNLHELSDVWQAALINDQVAIDFAQEMLKQSHDIQDKMWHMISVFRLGKNRQREFFALLSDVAQLSDQSLEKFLDSESIQNIQAEEKLTPSQKTERLKAWLWEQRYPRYSKTKTDYEAILKAAHLPQGCYVQSPPFFEGDTYSAGFSFSSLEEFENNIAALKKAVDDGTIKNILDLT